jgi:hypothetical protein
VAGDDSDIDRPVAITAACNDISEEGISEEPHNLSNDDTLISNLKRTHLFVLNMLSKSFKFGRVHRFLNKINAPRLSQVSSITFNSSSDPNPTFKSRHHPRTPFLKSSAEIILHLAMRGTMRRMTQD